MILVDSQIKNLIENDMLIIEGYKEENLGCVSYDLSIDKIIVYNELDEYEIKPGEFVIIKTKEKLKIPNNVIGHIEEKNSLIRLGLFVTGPMYQPGHETYGFLRVYNMTNKNIILKNDFNIAQIVFEVLNQVPNRIYSDNQKSSFNNENEYLEFGKYKDEFKKIIK